MKTLTQNMDRYIREFLQVPQKIAVVGMSSDPNRPSRSIPEFLETKGHQIIPIHPILKTIGKWKTKRSLVEVKDPTAVIIYLSKRNVDKAVKDAMKIRIPWIWLPLGIRTNVEDEIKKNGLILVQDRCPKIEWERLIGERKGK